MKLSFARPCVWVFLFLLYVPLFAQIKPDQPIPTDPLVKTGKLSNGLTYYIRRNVKPAKKVELRLVVNAGSVLEENNQLGLAHFMEHMSFNGSKHFPKNDLVNYLQKVGVKFGADLNAYTSFDETVYMLPISSDNPAVLEKGFTVLEDWAFHNLLDSTEIEKERGVVLEELRLSKGASERLRRQYFPKLLNGSLYAERLPIGKDSILKKFSGQTLKQFYTQWYRPDLMAVVVVGDIDPVVIEKKIQAHFGRATNPAQKKPRPAVIPIQARTQPEALVLTDAEATNTILQIFNYIQPAKKVVTWNDYREELVKDLITSLINQRLDELTRKENPPFNYGYTGISQFLRGYEVFQSFAVIGNNPVQKAVEALITETQRAQKFGFLNSEVDRAKADLLNETEEAYNERNKTESGQLAIAYIDHFLDGAPVPGIEKRYAFIRQVLPTISVNEINTWVKNMPVNNSNAFALVTAPAIMKDKLPPSDSLLQQMVAAANRPVTPYEEKVIASQLLDQPPVSGKIVKETKNAKLGITDIILSNGVTVTLKPTSFKNDNIEMDAWRWGGFHRFDLADKCNAKNAAVIITQMGVKDLSPIDLNKFLSGKTVSVSPYINNHEEGIEGSSSIKDFETFLQLMYLYFTDPRKDESLFRSYVNKQKSSILYLKQNPRYYYQDTLIKITYNNNPWANTLPTEEDYDGLNLEKVFSIYRQIYGNAYGMHFTFVGNIDSVAIRPLLEKYVASLPAAPQQNFYKDNGVRPVRGVVKATIQKGLEPQSIITLVFNGNAVYTPEENLKLQALLEVMNIKVIEKLREEMSGTYNGRFYGSLSQRPYQRYNITASIPCGPENVPKLTTALKNLIQSVQQNGVELKDLNKVKENWKKQHRVDVQNNDYWMQSLSNAWINRENPEEILTFEKRVQALTAADLQKTAQKYFDWNNYVEGVLYPEEETKPAKAF